MTTNQPTATEGDRTPVRDALRRVTGFLASTPEAGRSLQTADAELGERFRVVVSMRPHEVVVDEPAVIGGGDEGPTPVQMALAALSSCQAITYRIWSERLGIPFDELTVRAEGTYDVRGLLGVDGLPRPGFTRIGVSVRIHGPETTDRYEELRAAVDRHCPLLDLVTTPVQVTTELVASPDRQMERSNA